MIITPEQANLKAEQQFDALREFVDRAARAGQRIDAVERELFRNCSAWATPCCRPSSLSRATETSDRRPRPPTGTSPAGSPSGMTAATSRSSAR